MMKKKSTITILLLMLGCLLTGCVTIPPEKHTLSTGLRDGDILFQDSHSPQSAAIKALTHSDYCHTGIYFREGEQEVVYHAGSPVRRDSFASWTAEPKGVGDARRIRPEGLSAPEAARLKAKLRGYMGKPYDVRFQSSDENFYCSELVYKAYKEALGVELGTWQKFSDFNLSGEGGKILLKRYKDANVPFNANEPVISPERIRTCSQLVPVALK